MRHHRSSAREKPRRQGRAILSQPHAGQRRGPQPPMRWGQVFASYADVLDSAVDAVLISSPPDVHRPQVVAALAAGKGVLVEKPLCATADDLAAIGAAAAAHPDALLMIAENYYYKPSLKLLKRIIRQGFIGQVQQAIIGKRFTQDATGWKSSYGALLEGGIHFVALGADLFADAPSAGDRKVPRIPSGRAGAEFDSAGRIPIGSRARIALRLERLQLDQRHLSARADLGDRRADRLRVQWAIRAVAGAAQAALLSGHGGLDGLQGHDAETSCSAYRSRGGSRIRIWRGRNGIWALYLQRIKD